MNGTAYHEMLNCNEIIISEKYHQVDELHQPLLKKNKQTNNHN